MSVKRANILLKLRERLDAAKAKQDGRPCRSSRRQLLDATVGPAQARPPTQTGWPKALSSPESAKRGGFLVLRARAPRREIAKAHGSQFSVEDPGASVNVHLQVDGRCSLH